MSNTDRIFKPRRGTKSNFTNTELEGNKSNTVLDTGEVFFEVPDTGQGTGRGRIKMGDGITEYSNLPYFLPFTEDEIIIHDGTDDKTISASSSIQSNSIATNLNNAKSGNSLKNIIHNLREAIYKCACDISYLDSGSKSYIGMIIYSTVLDTSSKVISQYGGTTWISLSGYILRGATSSVTANSDSKDGGNDDLVVPYHSHTFTGTSKDYTSGNQSANHTHSGTTGNDNKDHTHSIGGGGHWVNAAGGHGHSISVDATFHPYPGGSNNSWAVGGNQSGNYGIAVGDHQHYSPDHAHTCGGRSAYHQHSFTTGDNSANHTHTTTVKPSGSISYAGTSGNTTNGNLPNYKNVYIWERTA